MVSGKSVPNQGMWRTVGTALRAGRMALVPALIVLSVCLIASSMWPVYTPRLIAILTLATGACVFTLFVLWFGGFDLIKHAILRAVLATTRQGPWDFPELLDEASSRNLMQRAGGG